MSAPILLDMTRCVARRLKGTTPSGIDRVCDAYARQLGEKAQAVVQLRGRAIILDRNASAGLFAALDAPAGRFRTKFARILARRVLSNANNPIGEGTFYINAGHSDFDRVTHRRWTGRRALRPLYFLHDLIPVTHPHLTTPHKTRRHLGRVRHAIAHGAGIIVNSQATADELKKFAVNEVCALPPVLVAPIAGAQLPTPILNMPSARTTFLSLGTIETRKNHALLLRVWQRLIDRFGDDAPRLILAGNWGHGSASIRRELARNTQLRRCVEVRSGLEDLEVAQLVASARAVLLPTMAEGFGLPLVEALNLGTPVIASDLASFREIGCRIPHLLDPADVSAWTGAIIGLMGESRERERQIGLIGSFKSTDWPEHFTALEAWMSTLSDGTISVAGGATFAPGHIPNYKTRSIGGGRGRELQC